MRRCNWLALEHYVKMIHNVIEYGLLQGMPRDMKSCMLQRFQVDLHRMPPSGIRKCRTVWLNELAERAFAKDVDLSRSGGSYLIQARGRGPTKQSTSRSSPPVITLRCSRDSLSPG